MTHTECSVNYTIKGIRDRDGTAVCGRVRSGKGTIILEMAITVPIVLITSLVILFCINCVKADVALSQAVDQVTNEASLAMPIMDVGLDLISEGLSDINKGKLADGELNETLSKATHAIGFVSALSEHIGIEGEDIFGTLIFGKFIRDQIVNTFEGICSNDIIYRSIDNISVYVDYDTRNRVVNLEVYYCWVTPFREINKKIISAVPIYGDLNLTLSDNQSSDQADAIWDKSNFERGHYFRELYGANLPSSFPVISSWNKGTATSIKSIDLTAPHYQDGSGLEKKIIGHINDLARYNGTDKPWGKDEINIRNSDINNRVLIIIIPENSTESALNEMEEYFEYARTKGVDVICKRHGVSEKYMTNTDADNDEGQTGGH